MESQMITRTIRLCVSSVLLFFAPAAFSQFTVVSTIPADGATQVDPSGTLEINFSAPLDTSARFDYPGQFYLHLLLYPDSLMGEPDWVAISADLKTVSVHNLHLYPNTKYFLLIVDAVSTGNDSLTTPYLATFTTGNSLPTATISGQVIFPQGDPQGTLVALLTHSPFSEEEGDTESGAIVQSPSGDFAIQYTDPGTYWPVALKDFTITAGGDVEPVDGGAIGFYDPNGDGEPDSIVVSTGEQVSGINIELFTLSSFTARHNYPAVLDSAQNWAADAVLVQLGTNEISATGQALIWMYAFHSPGLQTARGWMTFGEMMMPFDLTEPPRDVTPLPENWLDSDQIAAIAEAQGGALFRSQYADAMASAFLGSFDMGGPPNLAGIQAKTGNQTASGKAGTPFLRLPMLQGFQTIASDSYSPRQLRMVDSDPIPVWGFSYFSQSSGQQLQLLFDAVTGSLIQPPQPTATTARANLNTAQQAATVWAADAALIMVGNHASQITAEGEALMWFFVFHSASFDSQQVFIMSEGALLWQGQLGWEPPSKTPLPENWIDSNVAMAVAEANGGSQYRANDPDTVWVRGGVSYGLLPGLPDRLVWGFEYSSGYQAPLSIYVDALTGDIVTDVKEDQPDAGIPSKFVLRQNYPNPFNPETTIEYELPAPAAVELTVFNMMGQRVATLVHGYQAAGTYRAVWNGQCEDGRPAISGVYLYRLKAGGFEEKRKMLLLQ